MKKGIHPAYKATKISCVCGNVIETRSTAAKDVEIEICSHCHPLFHRETEAGGHRRTN